MEFKLVNNNGWEWSEYKSISLRGQVFSCYSNEEISIVELEKKMSEFDSISEYSDFLSGIDGFYSIIHKNKDAVYLITDRLRTMPIFYSVYPEIVISDSTKIFKSRHGFDDFSVNCFISTGYTLGSSTMLSGVKQVESSQIVKINSNSKAVLENDYFTYSPNVVDDKDEIVLINELESLYEGVFSSLLLKLNGRTAVVPLSGGYDSRLVVHMLHKLKYKNVLCFTYGEEKNWESEVSKKVAEYYGFDWTFVEYQPTELFELYQSEIDNYFDYSVNHSSAGHTQDFLAVKKLRESGLLQDDSVFIPGHSGDFVAGSHIPLESQKLDIVEYIYNKHCSLWPNPDEDKVKGNISKSLSKKENLLEAKSDQIEFWDWKERQAKYICNSVKVYEYFGYSWLLPLWDKKVMDFWLTVPVDHKMSRSLYYKFANVLHGGIDSNPKRSIYIRIKDRYFDVWFARFFGDSNSKFFQFRKLNSIFSESEIPAHLDSNMLVLKANKVGLNTLRMWSALNK